MRPSLVWALFAACLAVVLAATAWSTSIVLRLERAELQAKAQAVLEENARLALWRIDSSLTPLLAQESARPYFHYSPFYTAGGSYADMLPGASEAGALVPSPLLRETPPRVRLHFEIPPSGAMTSPQLPSGPLRRRAVAEGLVTERQIAEREARLGELAAGIDRAAVTTALAGSASGRLVTRSTAREASLPPQRQKSAREYEMRQQNTAQASQQVVADLVTEAARKQRTMVLEEGAMTPLWAGDALLLARQVRIDGRPFVQGCWLDWPRLQGELLASVSDLLPDARLTRAEAEAGAGADDTDPGRRLAALPLRLIPGAVPPPAASFSPVRLSLLGAWACVVIAALAVAGLLGGVLALSERRRVFVSAVTHELRTPLTTFRLYTDMLAGGMVASEEKRRQYLDLLRGEALRLGHLVENVLFYARLESGRAGAVRESLDLVALVRETLSRLEDRARKAGLASSVEDGGIGVAYARVDRSAVEQILVNLIDNACKYAASSDPKIVHVEISRRDRYAAIRVRDHGPGLTPAEARRLFRPFSKSDRDAAASAPGVGLGLALSRRLAQAQGGDLRLDTSVKDGAAFTLTLPLAAAEPAQTP